MTYENIIEVMQFTLIMASIVLLSKVVIKFTERKKGEW